MTHQLHTAVNWTAVQSLALVRSILHLEPCLDMLHGSCDEADCPSCHYARNSMSDGRQLVRRLLSSIGWDKDVFTEKAAIYGERSKHPVRLVRQDATDAVWEDLQ